LIFTASFCAQIREKRYASDMKHFFKHLSSLYVLTQANIKHSTTNPSGRKKEENRFLRLLKANRNMHFSSRASENHNYSHLATPNRVWCENCVLWLKSGGRYIIIMGQLTMPQHSLITKWPVERKLPFTMCVRGDEIF
jgi:hypothetical protein